VLAARVPELRVLLIDDDNSLRRALARAIRIAGFDVEAFASVEALLAHGMPEHDACLVLDVDLPGIGGMEFKRTLIAAHRDLPTVFITALPPAEVGEPLAALAPLAVLYKPFAKEDLLGDIARAGDRGVHAVLC
jgi:FixJ family two-component response regulator